MHSVNTVNSPSSFEFSSKWVILLDNKLMVATEPDAVQDLNMYSKVLNQFYLHELWVDCA